MKGPAPFLSSAREDKSLSRMGSAATRSPDRSRLKNSTQFGQSLSMARAAAAASPAMQTPVAPKGMVRVEDAHESADGAPGPSRVQVRDDCAHGGGGLQATAFTTRPVSRIRSSNGTVRCRRRPRTRTKCLGRARFV